MDVLRDEGYRQGPPPSHIGILWDFDPGADEMALCPVEFDDFFAEVATHLGVTDEQVVAAIWLVLRKRGRNNAPDDTSTMLMRLVAAGERDLYDTFPEPL